MASFAIQGGHRIEGTVNVSGNKNASFPLIAASLLTDETVTLGNVPQIDDIATMLTILEGLGVYVRKEGNRLTLRADKLHSHAPDARLFGRIRGGLNLMGPLLARRGAFQVQGTAGGDDIGRRRIDTHLLVFEQLGASFARPNTGRFELTSSGRLRGADILLDEASVTATQNAVMAASLAQGTTILRNTASEPHVQELCRLLVAMGCPIDGIGSNTLHVHGQERLHGASATVGPDYMEVGSFIGLGAITRGELRIANVAPDHLRMLEMVFCQRLGVRMHLQEDPQSTLTGYSLLLPDEQDLRVRPDFGGAIPKIDDAPWPAFPPDVMSIAVVVASQAQGTVLIHEKMFESRLYFVDKLVAMGAQIIVCDPHRIVVVGPSPLVGQEVSSPDIRAGMALVLAALSAEGRTLIGNIEQIDRGYQRVDEKLRAVGAHIERTDA
ncbi:MAG: UDP-N-acetylglucosamine 1-carboxyvinyltransferase [Caldilineaceae bacterium SB0670_bin_27]|uniref:UDP-N-acetylglucosamine 1-carboxyvinyltransferase n=1 Tax=Caldilineaceae bacterium SB0664_bin_27 TaxID=2605260 RepID=A0A6B0YPG4_9CHLR|nr:UDP-N-acetylglucosamine 1-carboxyvinyltransferase [Caldilineaceae bacterium SB0664_bin_27]MYJ78755.1 UDP-N-acetylglucosamine 1-carboxyvinyltransferase [Caldilineaceae bacterium SB0670_bin_27]